MNGMHSTIKQYKLSWYIEKSKVSRIIIFKREISNAIEIFGILS